MRLKIWKKYCAFAASIGILTGIFCMPVNAQVNTVRNQHFTTNAEMQSRTGSEDKDSWLPAYLTKVEGYFWNFSSIADREHSTISLNLASNAYQNLEMFLDNGYLMDYNVLHNYAEDYKARAGREDAYYRILADCLRNPYLQNKPEAEVTDTTYNGRDYSTVFDARYYYQNNPDLQAVIGYNPPELLRHFVECGINEGRIGSADFSIAVYQKQIDAEVSGQMLLSGTPGAAYGVGKYSYSLANYYGKYLEHYNYESLYTEDTEEAW